MEQLTFERAFLASSTRSMSGDLARVDALIKRYPNFPKPGILFYDSLILDEPYDTK